MSSGSESLDKEDKMMIGQGYVMKRRGGRREKLKERRRDTVRNEQWAREEDPTGHRTWEQGGVRSEGGG